MELHKENDSGVGLDKVTYIPYNMWVQGQVSEWLKEEDCKSFGSVHRWFESNPAHMTQ